MARKKMNEEFAIYRGDDFLFLGTVQECSEYLGVSENTIKFYASPANHKRAGKRNRIVTVRVDYDEDEECLVN